MNPISIRATPFDGYRRYKLPMPLRISAMAGASLVLWGAILIPLLA